MPFILLAPIEAPTPVPQTIRPRSAWPEVMAAATLARDVGEVDRLGIVGADILDFVAELVQEGEQLRLHGKARMVRADDDLHECFLLGLVGGDQVAAAQIVADREMVAQAALGGVGIAVAPATGTRGGARRPGPR